MALTRISLAVNLKSQFLTAFIRYFPNTREIPCNWPICIRILSFLFTSNSTLCTQRSYTCDDLVVALYMLTIFTRTWLHYVRVFAIAIPSVCVSVTLVHHTHGVEAFGNISSPLCTLAILWPSCKILRRSSQGNPSAGSVKRKRGIKIERFWTYRSP